MQTTRRAFLRGMVLTLPVARIAFRPIVAAAAAISTPQLDTRVLGVQVPLHRRDEWTSVAPRLNLLKPMTYIDRLTIHHSGVDVASDSATSAVVSRLGGIMNEHLERSYGDVGYHFLVDFSGGVWEGRSLSYEGAHVSGQNEANVGILLVGNFEKQEPSEAQRTSLIRLVSAVRDLCGIKQHRVYGHRDLGSSVCPGGKLYPMVVGMRG